MEQLAAALLEAYDLPVLHAERIDFGIWEESFTVHTARGRYFAKRFRRKDRLTETMVRGLELSQSLLAAGVPAPRLVRTRSGEAIAEVAGERYQVNDWVEGVTYHPGELPLSAAGPMGALLGRFHRAAAELAGPGAPPVPSAPPFPAPADAITRLRALLDRYADRPEPFAGIAREVLQEQLTLLAEVPPDLPAHLPLPALGGPCFHSFWVEQVMFRPDGAVAALVDWSDGAGRPSPWVDDLETGIHLSALDEPRIAAFVAGYQAENPLPRHEWRALAAALCYGCLASTNFLGGWFSRPYRRMAEWEHTSAIWHREVPRRFRRWPQIDALIREVARV